jgi:hypothetical protein
MTTAPRAGGPPAVMPLQLYNQRRHSPDSKRVPTPDVAQLWRSHYHDYVSGAEVSVPMLPDPRCCYGNMTKYQENGKMTTSTGAVEQHCICCSSALLAALDSCPSCSDQRINAYCTRQPKPLAEHSTMQPAYWLPAPAPSNMHYDTTTGACRQAIQRKRNLPV